MQVNAFKDRKKKDKEILLRLERHWRLKKQVNKTKKMGPFRSWYQYLSQSAGTERRWFYGF